jgi:hypothetical protein
LSELLVDLSFDVTKFVPIGNAVIPVPDNNVLPVLVRTQKIHLNPVEFAQLNAMGVVGDLRIRGVQQVLYGYCDVLELYDALV